MFHCLNVNCSEQLEPFYQLVSAFATRFLVRITPKNIVGFVAQEDGFGSPEVRFPTVGTTRSCGSILLPCCALSLQVADLCDLTTLSVRAMTQLYPHRCVASLGETWTAASCTLIQCLQNHDGSGFGRGLGGTVTNAVFEFRVEETRFGTEATALVTLDHRTFRIGNVCDIVEHPP